MVEIKAPLCDFCSAPNAFWLNPASNFPMLLFGGDRPGFVESQGPWRSCDECQSLIDANDIDGLHARVIAIRRADGEVTEKFSLGIRETYRLFFANRTGPAERSQANN